MRITDHPILGKTEKKEKVKVYVDGKEMFGYRGEPIATMLMANGIYVHRYTKKKLEPRGVFCSIGRCTDCIMVVNGIPNIRTCVTPLEEGMKIETQKGVGYWGNDDAQN